MLADCQLAAREAAEEEQRRLNKAIDTRAALVDQLQALLNERGDKLDDPPESKPFKHKRVRLDPTDDAIFAAYINELDEVYAKTDDILRSRGLDNTDPNWDEPSETWIKDTDTGYFLYGGN
ncbi:hypothetical protein V7S43_009962 [Phytophthora oleae]|uniref:Uncharacterized protein n=1 Tax=Phytophthora oleae TaxID=2107226 RepID=A0ABD3FEF8_9STRA